MSLAQLFGLKETFRQRVKRARRDWLSSRRQSTAKRRRTHLSHFTLEMLEPRILLSAAPVLEQVSQAAIVAPAEQATPLVVLDTGPTGMTTSSDEIFPQDGPAAPTGLTAVDRPNDTGGAVNLAWTPSASGGVTEQRI